MAFVLKAGDLTVLTWAWRATVISSALVVALRYIRRNHQRSSVRLHKQTLHRVHKRGGKEKKSKDSTSK